MRAIAVGSADINDDESLDAARRFASGFRFERRRHPCTKLFFRAEHVQLVKAFLNDPQRFLQHF